MQAMPIEIRTSLEEPDSSAFVPHRPQRPDKAEGGKRFEIVSDYQPAGDQPQAIAELIEQVRADERTQVLLGVTGSGKTFTMAKMIEALQRPALVLAPNKILAAQLYGEFKSFFPDNAVEYFVSYYDYYQPEAYVPRTDTYIEKESSVNEAIDRMRHSAPSPARFAAALDGRLGSERTGCVRLASRRRQSRFRNPGQARLRPPKSGRERYHRHS